MSNPRALARRCAVQALYQWQLSRGNLAEIEQQFVEDLGTALHLYRRVQAGDTLELPEEEQLEDLLERYCRPKVPLDPAGEPESLPSLREQVRRSWPPELHAAYFRQLLHGVPKEIEAIDSAIGEFSDRPAHDIDPVERAILRIGTYELLFCPELPYRIAVNEAINLAKDFGASSSHRFVNGILDRIARRHRSAETAARRRP